MAQLAIPESFRRATFSLVAYGYLTGGADTVQMRICRWVFSYFSFCEFGCRIYCSKLGYFLTHLHPAHFWCVWTSLKECNKLKSPHAQLSVSHSSYYSSPSAITLFWFMIPFLGAAVPFSCLLPSYLGSFLNAFHHWSVQATCLASRLDHHLDAAYFPRLPLL